jgi:hypothetical protein
MGLQFDLHGGPRGPAAQEALIGALRERLPLPLPAGPTSQTPDLALIASLVGRGVTDDDARAFEAHHRLAVELRDPASGISVALSPDGTGWLHVASGASREATLPLMKLAWWCLETAVRHGYAIVDVDLDTDFGLVVAAYVRSRAED